MYNEYCCFFTFSPVFFLKKGEKMSIAVAVSMGFLAYLLWKRSQHHDKKAFRIGHDRDLYGDDPYGTGESLQKQHAIFAVLCAIGAWISGVISFVALIYPFLLL